MQRVQHVVKRSYHASKRRAQRVHQHPAGLPLVLFALLLALSGAGFWYATRQGVVAEYVARDTFIAIVSYDGQKSTIPTTAKTVGDLLKKLDITLAPGDRVEPAADEAIAQDNFLINVYRSVPIALYDGAQVTYAKSAAATPRSMAAATGVNLYGEDTVDAEPTKNFVLQKGIGHRVVVNRAVPILLTLYGQPLSLRTQAETVGDLLREKGITLRADDTVKPSSTAPLSANMQVAVVRNGVQVITVTEDIPAPVKNVIDMSLSFGSQAVRQEGSAGKRVQTYEINVQKGEEISRKLLQSVVTVQPVERIVAKGNTVNIPSDKVAVMAAAGISQSDYAYVDYIFSRESRWNAAAMNAGGCGGLGQACPAGKLAAVCPAWQTDAVCQTKFISGYAIGRYGSWQGAYNAWLTKHWW